MTPILQGRAFAPDFAPEALGGDVWGGDVWGGFAAGWSRAAGLGRRYRPVAASGRSITPVLIPESTRAMSCEVHPADAGKAPADDDAIGPARPAPRAAPLALDGQSFGQRFRYWYGQSGRRYLFSEIGGEAVTDLTEAVYLVAGPPGAEARPLHVGDTLPPASERDGRIFVHLLADTAAERARIVADLTPAPL